ncbi:hypothetical protein G9A89_005087 [Geosiphon pyriformis]|nr:hypothetical protein G9A89_005087 [Geosiphon pyriformis]
MVKKTKSSENATSGGALETITNRQRFVGWVASILVPSATFKIKLAHIKAIFQSVHGFLNAKSVSKNNVKLFCVEFASQVSLEAAFLIELTSSVHLATLKIAKSLVISKSGFFSAAVALCNVLLDVSAADIKTALSVFGSVTHIVLKPAGIWQYVVVYFEKLNSAVSALNHWSVLVDKDSIRILPLVNQNKTILSCNKFKAKLSGHCFWFALITFGSQADLNSAIVKTVVVGNSLVLSRLSFLESDLTKLSALVEFIVKPIGFLVTIFEQFINGDLVLSSALGLRINEVLVYMGFFSRTVGKLVREVVSLKKKCCMKDINMSGNSELPPVMGDEEHKSVDVKTNPLKTAEWLVGLVFCSTTLFSVIQKMLSLGKFSSIVLA